MDGTADFTGATFLSRNNPKDLLVCRVKGVGVNPCPGRKQRRGNIHAIAFNGGERGVVVSVRERSGWFMEWGTLGWERRQKWWWVFACDRNVRGMTLFGLRAARFWGAA
jgi:hypothetical protein